MRIKTELLVCIFFSFILFSCTTTKPNSSFIEAELLEAKPKEVVAIVSPRVSKKKFSSVDSLLLKKVENARQQDLQESLNTLKKKEGKLSKDEEDLLLIIYALQALVYQEKIDESLYLNNDTNSYAAIISATKKGVYDFNAGEEDFFALTLPSLVLITAPGVQNFYEEASISLQKALLIHPESFLAEYLYAMLLERKGDIDEALLHYQLAVKYNPSFTKAGVLYMKALSLAGFEKEALEKALDVLQKEEHNLDALLIAAQASYAQKNYDAAETYISRLLQREPNNSNFILLRAKILMAKEEYMKVSSLLDIYAKTDKTSREYLLLKTLLQRDWNKNLSAAANTLQDALRLYPQDLELLLIAATVSAQLGQKVADRSLEEMLRFILEKEPNNAEALGILVGEDILQENWEEAYAGNSKLYEKGNQDGTVLSNHILISLALGKNQEAREAYTLLQRLKGEQDEVLLYNIRILIAENETTRASSLIERLLGQTTNSRTKSALYYERSKLSKNAEQRLNDLRLSLTANPRNAEALFSLYRYYFDQKEYRKAQYYLKQAVSLNPNSKKLLELNKELDVLLAE